jgi:hypothetical protein
MRPDPENLTKVVEITQPYVTLLQGNPDEDLSTRPDEPVWDTLERCLTSAGTRQVQPG